MAEDREDLQRLLMRLREQLKAVPTIEADASARLQSTIDEIQRAAENPAAAGSAHTRSLAQGLSEAALEFEALHPTLAGTIGSVIDALGRMGI